MPFSTFPLFQSHLDLAHNYWERLLKKGDLAIDATCGNGHDTLCLSSLTLTKDSGLLWGLDIQHDALEATRQLLKEKLPCELLPRVHLYRQSHASFPADIAENSVRLIVYNLGYLPGGNKSITTRVESTTESLEKAGKLICPGGAISITCYPGHTEGAEELQMILNAACRWPPQVWSCTHHTWLNRRNSPTLLLIQKQQQD